MKKKLFIVFSVLLTSISFGQDNQEIEKKRIVSTIDSTKTPELVLIQEFTVKVPVDSVWNAYTTKEGYENWAAAIAAITLHILNYLPKRLLTLQAELTKNFPDFMKEDEKDLYNVIFFEKINPKETKVISYGIGYKNNEKYMSLMKFFIQGNEKLFKNLITYLETGKPSVKY